MPSVVRRWTPLLLAAVVIAGLAAVARVFVWPASATEPRGDAVVVMAGTYDRLAWAGKVVCAGAAPVLVISDPEGFPDDLVPCDPSIVTFRPRPPTTAGEARAIATLARQRGWTSLVVVTSPYHMARARTVILQCFQGDVAMVATPTRRASLFFVGAVAKELVALPAAMTVRRAC